LQNFELFTVFKNFEKSNKIATKEHLLAEEASSFSINFEHEYGV
jgi:hypothetical protein